MNTLPGWYSGAQSRGDSNDRSWIARVMAEKDELDQKIVGLTQSIFSPGFAHTVPAEMERLLRDQLRVMQNYSEILAKRLEIA
jgi:hypothetical protein